MLCTFRYGNLTGSEIKLQYKAKGSGKIRFGAARYRADQKAPDKSDSFKSELMELGSDYKDYEFAVAFDDQPQSGVNFLFEILGEGGEAVIDSMTVSAIGDTACVIQPPDPIMVKDTALLPDVKFQTNRPGRKFHYYTALMGDPKVAHGGTAVADEKGEVTVPGKSLRQDPVAQELYIALEGNAAFHHIGVTGCELCDLAMVKTPTVGTVMITKIPSLTLRLQNPANSTAMLSVDSAMFFPKNLLKMETEIFLSIIHISLKQSVLMTNLCRQPDRALSMH